MGNRRMRFSCKQILAPPLRENSDEQIYHWWKTETEFLGRGGE